MSILAKISKQDRLDPKIETHPRALALEPEVTPEVAAFIDSSKRLREDLAYYKSHSAQLENDVKFANERIRSLEVELDYVRDERDRLYRHDHNMLGGLGAIKAAIVNLEEQSRAEAYAPPGSGQREPEQPLDAAAEAGLKIVASSLAPKQDHQEEQS